VGAMRRRRSKEKEDADFVDKYVVSCERWH